MFLLPIQAKQGFHSEEWDGQTAPSFSGPSVPPLTGIHLVGKRIEVCTSKDFLSSFKGTVTDFNPLMKKHTIRCEMSGVGGQG